MHNRLGLALSPKYLIQPRSNHWLRRIALVFAFIMFDYLSTLAFCRAPHEEANMYARLFMESFGVPAGLTLFVVVANLPIYMTLSVDSHLVRLPFKLAVATEMVVDGMFAWFVAGVHFSGGTSWFWAAPDLPRQFLGTVLYLIAAFLLVKPHMPRYEN